MGIYRFFDCVSISLKSAFIENNHQIYQFQFMINVWLIISFRTDRLEQ